MASYNGDFNQMQEEALARLREMQKRSRTVINQPVSEQHTQTAPPQNFSQNGRQNRPQNQSEQNTQNRLTGRPDARSPAPRQDIFKSLFGDMKIDSEKALILLMLFVLYKNKADIKLLLALGYLLV